MNPKGYLTGMSILYSLLLTGIVMETAIATTYDDFDDNSLDLNKWDVWIDDDTTITETGRSVLWPVSRFRFS